MRVCWLLMLGICACPSAPSHRVPEYAALDTEEREGPLPVERGRVTRAFLYQVDAEIPSLILGTTNAGVAYADLNIGADALDNIRVVLLDVRVDEMTARDLQRARMPSDTLETWIGTLAWRDLLDEVVGTATADDLRTMRPWYAYGLLVSKRTQALFNGEVPPSMNYTLVQIASDLEIPIRTLEGPAQRVAVMNSIPNGLLGEVLGHVIENPTQHELHLRAVLHKYRRGDETALLEQLTTGLDLEANHEVYERFYIQRTEEWLPTLRAELDQGNAFVAMDVGHLLGPQGMLETLRGLGYSVDRVE